MARCCSHDSCWIVVTCGTAKVLFSAVVSSTFTIFPLESQKLGFTTKSMAIVLATFPLAYLLALFPISRICDKVENIRGVLVGGILGLSLSSVAFGTGSTIWLLAAARSAQGVFSAAADVASGAYVAAYSGERLAYNESLLESSEALGWILGPPLGAFVYARVGFSATCNMWAIAGAALLLALLGRSPPATTCDYKELQDDPEQRPEEDKGVAVIPVVLFATRGSSVFAYGICSGAMYSGLTMHNRDLGIDVSASLQLLVAVSYLFAAPVVGKACDSCDESGLWLNLAIGWIFLTFGFLALAVELSGAAGIAVALLLLGVGEAYVLVPAYPLLTLASPSRPGLVSAVFNGCWAVGQGSGPFVLALITWHTAMYLASVLSFLLACAFARQRKVLYSS